MTQKRQHDAKASKGPQRETRDTSKAADTGSAAAKTPPKQRPEGQQKKKG
jgi:hypothetical protein